MSENNLKKYFVYWNGEVFYTLAKNEQEAILQVKNEIKEIYQISRIRKNIWAEEDIS